MYCNFEHAAVRMQGQVGGKGMGLEEVGERGVDLWSEGGARDEERQAVLWIRIRIQHFN